MPIARVIDGVLGGIGGHLNCHQKEELHETDNLPSWPAERLRSVGKRQAVDIGGRKAALVSLAD